MPPAFAIGSLGLAAVATAGLENLRAAQLRHLDHPVANQPTVRIPLELPDGKPLQLALAPWSFTMDHPSSTPVP